MGRCKTQNKLGVAHLASHNRHVVGENPTLALGNELREQLANPAIRERARARAARVLDSLGEAVRGAPWWSEQWLDFTLGGALHAFDNACGRWRDLYRAAQGQQRAQNRLANDASRPATERDRAISLRREADSPPLRRRVPITGHWLRGCRPQLNHLKMLFFSA